MFLLLTLTLATLVSVNSYLPFHHIGCYEDVGKDLYHFESGRMTTNLCYKHCDDADTNYMFLSGGNKCSCGSHVGNEMVWVVGCDLNCTGDKKKTCGGLEEFDVYEMSRPDPPVSEEYMDCFADCKDDRIMEEFVVIKDMTPESCRQHCVTVPGSSYYATQFSKECFCGKSSNFQDYDRHGRGHCHMGCAGNPDISCGGFNAFDLFKIVKDRTEEDPKKPKREPKREPREEPKEEPKREPREEPKEEPREEPKEEPMEEPKEEPKETEVKEEPKEPEEEWVKEEPKEPKVKEEPKQEGSEFDDLLQIHNSVRCKHGAEPLVYSSVIASSAQDYANKLASENCGNLVHSKGTGYGENLYYCGSTSKNCYSAAEAMNGWYDEEVNGGGVDTWGGHATQCLWKSTEEVGCGIGSCKGDYEYDVLVCQYSPPGNYMAKVKEEVGKLQSSKNC